MSDSLRTFRIGNNLHNELEKRIQFFGPVLPSNHELVSKTHLTNQRTVNVEE